jgi:hypothetical protein
MYLFIKYIIYGYKPYQLIVLIKFGSKKINKVMKKILAVLTLTMLTVFSGFSQKTINEKVYKKINLERKEANLSPLKIQESLELASAQHGCWLAMYNRLTDLETIELPENEFKVEMITTFTGAEDRVKNFTSDEFENLTEIRFAFYEEPTTNLIFSLFKNDFLKPESKNIGLWVVKFEDKNEKPIWYLVCLRSN